MSPDTLRPHNGLKFFLITGLLLGSAGYVLWQGGGASAAVPAAAQAKVVQAQPAASAPPPTPTASAPAPQPASPAPTPAPVPAPKPQGQYVDGTYTGPVTDAYYGLVQVKAVVSGGKLVDVQFLQYPSDRSTSRYINGQAMPLLRQEALQAQSASIDGVSGATDTSIAFAQSLSAALTQAKNS